MKTKRRGLSTGWILLGPLCAAASAIVTAADERITIVRGYEGMARYATAASGADDGARSRLYARHVGEPYGETCSGAGDAFGMSRGRLNTPIRDLAGLRNASTEISKRSVDARITEAVQKAARLLPMKSMRVCLFVFPPDDDFAPVVREKMSGLMGFNEAPGIFWLEVLPAPGWFEQLQYGTVHEFAHAVVESSGVQTASLLETLLNEGRADAFAALLYPERLPLWTHALTPNEERTVWTAMQPHLDSTDSSVQAKFVSGAIDDDEVPLFAGYTIGFRIAQSYLKKHPQESASGWMNLDARTFLKNSGYEPAQNPTGGPASQSR